MIHFELSTSDIIEVLNKRYGRFDFNTTRTFYRDSTIIGFADYFIVDEILYLKNFRVTKRRKRFGSLIIHYLFNNLKIKAIHGYSLNIIANSFWISLGATFPKTSKDSFIIYKDNIK